MRVIHKIIIHCSATKKNGQIGAKEIDVWHKQRGFNAIGYHFVILRDGSIEDGRSVSEVGAHCLGYNHDSLGICLVGGLADNGDAENNFTKEQMQSLKQKLIELVEQFPFVKIMGHRDLAATDCPCFEVREFLEEHALASNAL